MPTPARWLRTHIIACAKKTPQGYCAHESPQGYSAPSTIAPQGHRHSTPQGGCAMNTLQGDCVHAPLRVTALTARAPQGTKQAHPRKVAIYSYYCVIYLKNFKHFIYLFIYSFIYFPNSL